jgi:hypothetical protein
MKIRQSFVANSSSSSFVITNNSNETKLLYDIIIDTIFDKNKFCETCEILNELLMDVYSDLKEEMQPNESIILSVSYHNTLHDIIINNGNIRETESSDYNDTFDPKYREFSIGNDY